MKINQSKEKDWVVLSVQGCLQLETQDHLREKLQELHTEGVQRVIFNLKDLEFVGSTHISHFIQLLKEFHQNSPEKPRYCGVRSEFQRLMRALDSGCGFEFHDSLEKAIQH